MKNYRTNLGGAVSVVGTTLIGVGVMGNMQDGPYSKVLWWIALVGFIISAIGKGLTALFAADATTVQDLHSRVVTMENNSNPAAFRNPNPPDKPAQP